MSRVSHVLRANVTCVKRRIVSEAYMEAKKDRPERRPKSREETPKLGMRSEERETLLTLHCKFSKAFRGLFIVCDRSDAVVKRRSARSRKRRLASPAR